MTNQLKVRITTETGRASVIEDRIQDIDYRAQGITIMSCSSPQPFIARNYDRDGKQVGGMAITEQSRNALLQKAQEMGWTVSEIR